MVAPVAPPAPSVVPNDGSKNAVVRVLYRNDWFGPVTLLGVDAAKMRAVVRMEGREPARVVIDTIDLKTGQRVERWEADEDHAKKAIRRDAAFRPLSDSVETDVSRFANVLDDLGPWHLRQPLSSPSFAVSPRSRHVLYGVQPTDGSQGDWLFAKPKDGSARRVDQGLVASYSPSFSPDGEAFAFVGCAQSPCDYGLFVARVNDDERPRRVAGIQRSTPPMWSANGESVLAVGSRAAERCLFKAPAAGGVAKALACTRGLEDVSFAQDPDGRTVAIGGVRGTPGKQVVDVTWVLVADGSVLGTQSVERAVGSSVLSAAGLMAMPMQRGSVGALDLITGTSTVLPESEGWFFGFEGARWIEDSLVLLRKTGDEKGFDIVAIDVRKASGRRNDPWL